MLHQNYLYISSFCKNNFLRIKLIFDIVKVNTY